MKLLLPRDKKGVLSLAQAAPVVIVLMTIGIVLTVGLLIMAEVDEQIQSTVGCNDTTLGAIGGPGGGSCYESVAFNATIETQEGLDVLATFQSIFGIIVAAAIVLGVIMLFR